MKPPSTPTLVAIAMAFLVVALALGFGVLTPRQAFGVRGFILAGPAAMAAYFGTRCLLERFGRRR